MTCTVPFVQFSLVEGELTSVVWPCELQDEKTLLLFFPVYRLGIRPFPLSCHVGVGLHLLTFQMQVVHLIPGPLSSVNLLFRLRQALEPRHRLLCNDGPPSGGVLNAFPQPPGHVVVGPDPGLLERRTETLDVALRLCRVAAERAGRRGYLAPLMQHGIARERSSNRLEHLLLRGSDLHLPQYLAQCAPTLI